MATNRSKCVQRFGELKTTKSRNLRLVRELCLHDHCRMSQNVCGLEMQGEGVWLLLTCPELIDLL